MPRPIPLSRARKRAPRSAAGGILLGELQLARTVQHKCLGTQRYLRYDLPSTETTIVSRKAAPLLKLACQEQLLPGDDLVAKFDFARRAGFDGIELRAKGNDHFKGRLPELRAAVRAGVVMKTVCPETDHFIGDFDADQRRDAIAQIRTQLSVIAEIGAEGMLTPASWGMFSLRLPPFAPPRTAEDDRKVLLEALIPLAEHAEREGVWLALEALNRYEDYMINRLDQIVGLAKEVEEATGTRSIRACADFFHLNIEEDDMAKAIVAAGPWIVHVHVDDSNRMQPGTGHLDFANAFRALRAIDYDGWHTLECRLRGEPETARPRRRRSCGSSRRCATGPAHRVRRPARRLLAQAGGGAAGAAGRGVRGVHVLPFYLPYDGADAGFDPDDHLAVDPRLGTWDDWRRWRGAATSPRT